MRGSNLDNALGNVMSGAAPKDASFIRAMAYGVLRDLRILNHLAGELLDKPLKKNQNEIMQLILVGIFQLRSMRVAEHGAVDETVSACNALRQPRARGLVNAILRRYQREAETLEAGIPEDLDLRLSHPRWISKQLQADWPENWQDIMQANQKPGAMVLRVNRRQQSRDEYLEKLQAADIPATEVAGLDSAIELESAVDVLKLPGFAEGAVSVQDSAAQHAATLLDAGPGMRILDACAAPGGKTAHLLELHDDIKITALDQDPERLKRVAETLTRLQLDANNTTLQPADASQPEGWWSKQTFDRILLDAPCSGSGVIRRHPDIKWLRRASDIDTLAAKQLAIINALWPLLAPGGKLLYATCSIFKAEGEEVISQFTQAHPDAKACMPNVTWGVASGAGRAILPDPADGFFYCLLQKEK